MRAIIELDLPTNQPGDIAQVLAEIAVAISVVLSESRVVTPRAVHMDVEVE